MSTIQSARSVPMGAVSTLGVVNFFERAANAVSAWRSARVTAKALSDLTDKQLADIGLIRGDIPDVAETLARR